MAKCHICGSKLDDLLKCTTCYDAKWAECNALRRRNAELEAQLSGYSSATPSYVKGLEAEVKLLDNRRTELCKTSANKSCKIANLEAEVASLQTQLGSLMAEFVTLREKLEAEVARLRKALEYLLEGFSIHSTDERVVKAFAALEDSDG